MGVFRGTLIVNPEETVARRGYSCCPVVENGYFLAVLFMDLEGFKLLNDSLGPGDREELLNDVAGHSRTPRMRRSVQRDADQQSIAARVGGDSSSGTVAQFPSFSELSKIPRIMFLRCTSAG